MGVEVRGKLKGYISPQEVLNFIQQTIDSNAKSYVRIRDCGIADYDWIKERYDTTNKWIIINGYIDFTDKNGELRSLFYCYKNVNSYENLEYYSKYGLEDMVKSETTDIMLDCHGESVNVIKSIVTEFGGWIDENDCDDEEYYPIEKDSNGNIKQVFHVTMEDIYEKFGGIVIIDK